MVWEGGRSGKGMSLGGDWCVTSVLRCRRREIGGHPRHHLRDFRHLALESRDSGGRDRLLAVEPTLHGPQGPRKATGGVVGRPSRLRPPITEPSPSFATPAAGSRELDQDLRLVVMENARWRRGGILPLDWCNPGTLRARSREGREGSRSFCSDTTLSGLERLRHSDHERGEEVELGARIYF